MDKYTTNNSITQAFIQKSLEERKKMTNFFTQNNITSFDFTPIDGYDRYDGTFENKKKVIFEVKVRDIESSRYSTTIIEKSKVDYLIKEAEKQERIPFIFFYFNDNKVMIQELHKDVYYNSVMIKCPQTTAGNNEMVWKECVEFKITNLKNI